MGQSQQQEEMSGDAMQEEAGPKGLRGAVGPGPDPVGERGEDGDETMSAAASSGSPAYDKFMTDVRRVTKGIPSEVVSSMVHRASRQTGGVEARDPNSLAERLRLVQNWAETYKSPLAKMERADLAEHLYATVSAQVESFEHDDMVGPDLAYLMGMVLQSRTDDVKGCEWPEDRKLVRILKDCYHPEHMVWKHVTVTAVV